MEDLSGTIESVRAGIVLFRDAIGLARDTKDLLPEGDDRDTVERSLAEADKAASIAQAQIAQALGYKLCKCTFPPQIMLSNGYKERNYQYEEEYVCPGCGKSSLPPPSKPIPRRPTNRT